MAELTLRICVHIEHFFMLRDLENMCDYLRMEIDLSQKLRQDVEKSELPQTRRKLLHKHYEVLEQIVHSSAYG
jgi:hypothetical protein